MINKKKDEHELAIHITQSGYQSKKPDLMRQRVLL
jgi:hypothetical protein